MPDRISTVIARKGSTVVTIPPSATLADAAALLGEHRIGALVVSSDGHTVEGLISERDVVWSVADHGAKALDLSVADTMVRNVVTCSPDATINELAALMTERRFRHVPVVEAGRMIAIVSIGDIVKARIDALSSEADQLQAYVAGSY